MATTRPIHVIPTGELVALVGNPNCGKTATFNALTGAHQKVANYAGVTVEKIEGVLKDSAQKIRILDLPGAYSLNPRSPDERITVDVLKGVAAGEKRPDLAVCICDATNLRRSLRIVTATIRLGLPTVVVLNMMDLARKLGIQVDPEALSKELGVPVIATAITQREGLEALVAHIQNTEAWKGWVAPASFREVTAPVKTQVNDILRRLGLDRVYKDEFTDRLDSVILHPLMGPAILMVVLFVLFQAVFSLAEYPMGLIEEGFGALGELVRVWLPEGWVQDLIVDAVIGGVGGVLVFLPQLLILFFFIMLMEECGYLPRAAYLLDRMMGGVGLSGRSFVPLLSGFACAIPAVMAARTISDPIDRWVTIAIAPLLTCSARLPVYAVMISAFIPEGNVGLFNLQGLVLFALYILGTIGALAVAWFLKHFVKNHEHGALMMELPAYHIPRAKTLAMGLWLRTRVFMEKVGGIILALTVVIWLLTTYPAAPADATGPAIEYSLAGMIGHAIEPIFAPIGFNWQMCVAMIPAFGAREVAISALATVYAVAGESEEALAPVLSTLWTVPMGLSMLAFYVFSPSCLATLAAIRRETGSWLAPFVIFVGYTALAYLFAFVVYHLAIWIGL